MPQNELSVREKDFQGIHGSEMTESSSTLRRLLEVRRLLVDQLIEVDKMIAQLQGIDAKVSTLSPTVLKLRQVDPASKPRLRPRSQIPPSEIANRVETFLREAKRPMTRSELASKLIESGVILVGADVNKNVGTIMWRYSDRFVNLPKLGYWLAAYPLPGVYDPDTNG